MELDVILGATRLFLLFLLFSSALVSNLLVCRENLVNDACHPKEKVVAGRYLISPKTPLDP